MNFLQILLFLISFLKFSTSSSADKYRQISSLIEVFNLAKDSKRQTTQFSRFENPIKFLLDRYEARQIPEMNFIQTFIDN